VSENNGTLSACAVSDAMDRLGLQGTIPSLIAMSSGDVVIGPAYTVRFVEEGSGRFNQYVPSVPAGSVVVLDAGGRTDVSAWGGIIAAEAQRLGLRATVIYGACRDRTELGDLGYPVFALSSTPASGRGVISSDETDVVLHIDGIDVHPGDTIVADADGAVAVPRDRADEVLALAREIADRDTALHGMVGEGVSLDDARQSLV